MLLLIFGIITFFVASYFYLIWPRRSRKRQIHPFLHTMFAHRGYHCIEKGIPENSIPSFRAAISRGYGIELDVHLSKDGQLIVFHDDTLERICGRPEQIENLSLKELKTCRLSNTDETIPLLTDVLSLVDGRVPLLIELKIPKTSLKICQKTWDVLSRYQGPFMVQSFNTLGIWWFRRHVPHVLRGQLSSNLTADNLPEPWIRPLFVKHLLGNVLGRPDFISYKLADLPSFEVWFLKRFLRLPIAVWTLRTPDALKKGKMHYDMQIFERKKAYY